MSAKRIALAVAMAASSLAHAQQTEPVNLRADFGNQWELSLGAARAIQESGARIDFFYSSRVCGFPADTRAHIAARAGQGVAQARRMLETLESTPNLTGFQGSSSLVQRSTNEFNAAWGFTLTRIESGSRSVTAQAVATAWNAGQPLQLVLDGRCLTWNDATAWRTEARRVLRAYLGLPPA